MMSYISGKHPKEVPFVVYTDDEGNLFDDPELRCVGRQGNEYVKLKPEDFIEMPYGSDFFELENRFAVGYNRETDSFEVCERGFAAASFVAPAHTQTYMAAYENTNLSVRLPLYAYTAIGWFEDKFYVTAVRIDPDDRQDCDTFNQDDVIAGSKKIIKENPENRLIKHVSHCALVYYCPAARNYFLNRREAPLPSAPTCNSRCLGCISYQPKGSKVVSNQNRIDFVPTPEEIANLAVPHLETAPDPIVSFGQGCEGEPLTVWKTLVEAVKLIRKRTSKGIINLNSNASNPEAVAVLTDAGLDSIRVSMNSARKELYNHYYKPVSYTYEDVLKSMQVMKDKGKWCSINYFVFPGVTDCEEEFKAISSILEKYSPSMIQWRNFNIDPDWFMETIENIPVTNPMGIRNMMNKLKGKFPNLHYGYFNPGGKIINIK